VAVVRFELETLELKPKKNATENVSNKKIAGKSKNYIL
jgi:hypothetical protein